MPGTNDLELRCITPLTTGAFSPFPSTPIAEDLFANLPAVDKSAPSDTSSSPRESLNSSFGANKKNVLNHNYSSVNYSNKSVIRNLMIDGEYISDNNYGRGIENVTDDNVLNKPYITVEVPLDYHQLMGSTATSDVTNKENVAYGLQHSNITDIVSLEHSSTELCTGDTVNSILAKSVSSNSSVGAGQDGQQMAVTESCCLFEVVSMLKCTACSQLFPDTAALIRHYQTHHLATKVSAVTLVCFVCSLLIWCRDVSSLNGCDLRR